MDKETETNAILLKTIHELKINHKVIDDKPEWMKFIEKADFIFGLTIIASAEEKFGVKYDALSPTKWVKPISIKKSKKITEYCEKVVEKWKQEQSSSSKES